MMDRPAEERFEAIIALLRPPAGGDRLPPTKTDGILGGMDPWQQSVETRLADIHTDLRRLDDRLDNSVKWLLGAYGAGVTLILGALASGFVFVVEKLGH